MKWYTYLSITMLIFGVGIVGIRLSGYRPQYSKPKNIKLSLFTNEIALGGKVYTTNDYIDYDKGFNDALDAIMLLDLELKLEEERKNWGDMADICRKRFNVEKQIK